MAKRTRGVLVANVIHVIVPYRHASTWVFDDPRVGLAQEPFVSGIPEMIDSIVAKIPNAEKGVSDLVCFTTVPWLPSRAGEGPGRIRGRVVSVGRQRGGLALSGTLSVFSRSAHSTLRQSGGSVVYLPFSVHQRIPVLQPYIHRCSI
jgi:hypothetical protein